MGSCCNSSRSRKKKLKLCSQLHCTSGWQHTLIEEVALAQFLFFALLCILTFGYSQCYLLQERTQTPLQGDQKLVYSKCQPFEAWINGRAVSESAYGINSAPNQTYRFNHCGGFLENKGARERAFFSKIQPKIFGLLENQFKIG